MDEYVAQSGMSSQHAVVARVLRDARRSYGDRVDDPTIISWAQAAVADIWSDSIKVTTFVPLLAMRIIHEEAAGYRHPDGA